MYMHDAYMYIHHHMSVRVNSSHATAPTTECAHRDTHAFPHQALEPHAWVRLYSLLSRILLRSSKEDMEKMGKIPSCHTFTSSLQLSNSERRAYNGLISIIKRNLILAGGGGSNVDSLLHAKNRKFALEVCVWSVPGTAATVVSRGIVRHVTPEQCGPVAY
jgi:hypothetical protein